MTTEEKLARAIKGLRQELAWHSDPRLTIGIYSHTTHDRLATLVNTMAQQTAKVTEEVTESANGWLPIETAPKDGTWIFVLGKTWRYPTVAHWHEGHSQWFDVSESGSFDDWPHDFEKDEKDFLITNVVYWMPLPKPPG